MVTNLDEIIRDINELIPCFLNDMHKCGSSGNQSAGRRARVASVKLEKLFKEFRKKSMLVSAQHE